MADLNPNSPGYLTQTLGVDLSGNELIYAPKITISASADYRIPIGVDEMYLHANYYHNGRSFPEPDNQFVIKAYDTVDLQVGYQMDDGRFGVQLYANNVFDTRYLVTATPFYPFGVNAQAGDPRTYGVRLTTRF